MITLNMYSGKRHHVIWKHSGLWFESPDLHLSRSLRFLSMSLLEGVDPAQHCIVLQAHPQVLLIFTNSKPKKKLLPLRR